MVALKPFRALRPSSESAARVSAVPYDVVSTEEARAAAAGNPLSFLHVSRAEIDLPDGTNPYSDQVYARALENFTRLKAAAPLRRDDSASLYVYRLRMGDHEQTGVAGCASLDEYDRDVIRKHERTRKEKEDDRTRHMVTLSAQTGPVFLAYRDRKAVDAIVARVTASPPAYDFRASDGIQHSLWRAGPEDSESLTREFQDVPLFYIADGHHRAASSARTRTELAAKKPASDGSAEYNLFIVVAFPAAQLKILAYNRVVQGLGGRSPVEFLAALRKTGPVEENAPAAPREAGTVSIYLAGRWHGYRFRKSPGASPIEALDAEALHRQVLAPLLGIGDIRTDKRIDFVGGIRGPEELRRLVDSGKFDVAFSLYPVSLEQLMAVSDANEIMPPKSTWFEPKLRDGLLIHEI
ncbi:MAG TPA: DUF1015 family protein [Thermoanaerobaculia bacterium]|nr:DUF1015 family protein [Thermoanaerobaculia bacterium]